MRIPRLTWPKGTQTGDDSRPFWQNRPSVQLQAHKTGVKRNPTIANLPLWPDDDMKAHPDSPHRTKLSDEAIRTLSVLSGVSVYGPRLVTVTKAGAIRVAPALGTFLRSKEGTLDVALGASVTIGTPPATSVYIANDDATNAIQFIVANRMNTAGTAPDYAQATTQTLPGGSQPVGIDVVAYGVALPATGNASPYRIWWITD